MRYKIALIILFLLILENVYSQTIMDMRCVFYPQYRLDTTFNKDDEWRYLPVQKDSLFLYEEIIVSKWEKPYSYKEYGKILKGKLNSLRNSGFFYVEELGKGASNFNYFQDYIFYHSDPLNIYLNYQRILYNQKLKTKNYIYSINYKALIPKGWGPNEKWDLSIPHFSEKKEKIKFGYNLCRN